MRARLGPHNRAGPDDRHFIRGRLDRQVGEQLREVAISVRRRMASYGVRHRGHRKGLAWRVI